LAIFENAVEQVQVGASFSFEEMEPRDAISLAR
jgi:hypothetical protein